MTHNGHGFGNTSDVTNGDFAAFCNVPGNVPNVVLRREHLGALKIKDFFAVVVVVVVVKSLIIIIIIGFCAKCLISCNVPNVAKVRDLESY